jgi:hypothetical protein
MDFVKDCSGRHLLRINNLVTVPEYVKQASIPDDGLGDLPEHLFADPVRREFPIDSAGHTYLSQAYCMSAGIDSKSILGNIKSAMSRFPEVPADIAKLEAAMDASVKSSSVGNQPQFAVYVDFGAGNPDSEIEYVKSGGVKGFYPINDVDQVVDSAIQIGNESHRIPLELFVEGCQAIYKSAKDMGCTEQLPKTIVQYGVERVPDYEFVKQQAEIRARETNDPIYIELAASAEDDTEHDSNLWSELWGKADASHGVKYARHTLNPYQIFHSGMPKSAFEAAINKWTLLHGAAIPVPALQALKEDSISRVMSKEAADKVQEVLNKSASVTGAELANELSKLDKPIQLALLKLVAQ